MRRLQCGALAGVGLASPVIWRDDSWMPARALVSQLPRRLDESESGHGLEGDVHLRTNWECHEFRSKSANRCHHLGLNVVRMFRPDYCAKKLANKDNHEEEAPEVNAHCTERYALENLRRQIDVDLQCYGYNVTCDSMEELDLQDILFENCNEDPEILRGNCSFHCRANMHPTRRCVYEWDPNGKYGLKGNNADMWHHCVLASGCLDEKTEVYGVFCNKTIEDDWLFYREDDAHEETEAHNNGLILGASIGVGGTLLVACVGFYLHRARGKQQDPHSSAGPDQPNVENVTVVMGRPVAEESRSGNVVPPQFGAYTPPVEAGDGKPVAGTIAPANPSEASAGQPL